MDPEQQIARSARDDKDHRDVLLVASAASAISIFSLLWYWHRGELLLYGDAVAHAGIARRIFDSLTPGLRQLGTVWLPLPHLLMAPFVISDSMWRSGMGAALPSMLAYVFGTAGIFRLTRDALRHCFTIDQRTARVAGLLSVTIFALNPNLIYLQATAMNEPLYLAPFIWALVWLQEFAFRLRSNGRAPGRALMACGGLLCAASLTRYEGWMIAALCVVVAFALATGARQVRARAKALIAFALISLAAPVSWLAYNRATYGNALEFATGKYSAKAIEQRRSPEVPRHPGENDAGVATRYFTQSVLDNLGQSWPARDGLFWLGVLGALLLLLRKRALALLLLWAPLSFYVYSIAYGSVPVFVPELPPWSYYNVRYGSALLPAVAVSAAMGVGLPIRLGRRRAWQAALMIAVGVLVAACYVSACLEPHHRGHYELAGEPDRGPVVWREGKVIAFHREPPENALAQELEKLPADSRLLMSLAGYPGALQRAGIHLRRVLNEGNSRPLETGGLWNDALADPANAADFVIAIDGDPVAEAVARHPAGLTLVNEVAAGDRPHARIYASLLRKPQ